MNSLNEWREEERERAEERAKYGEKPDHLTDEEWGLLPEQIKEDVAKGRADDRELELFLERAKEQQNNT
ncbi:hypothetical protein [Halalkalicoccus jeotgali]|nr:hypothetical protein [Halalkalicoccus jeotgali]